MLTKLTIRNFKCFREVEIELGDPVVFIGPNNSAKTTALDGILAAAQLANPAESTQDTWASGHR